MFEELMKLVNGLPENQRAGFLAEINKLNALGLTSMPKDLATLLSDEKFADLKKQHDSILGNYRTKWEKEQLDKALADKGKTDDPGKEPKNKDFAEFMKLFSEFQKSVTTEIGSLKKEKELETLKAYTSEKTKDLPESFKGLIDIRDGMTTKDIDTKIQLLTKAHEDFTKSVSQQPFVGKPGKNNGSSVESWKESLPIKNKDNDKNAN